MKTQIVPCLTAERLAALLFRPGMVKAMHLVLKCRIDIGQIEMPV